MGDVQRMRARATQRRVAEEGYSDETIERMENGAAANKLKARMERVEKLRADPTLPMLETIIALQDEEQNLIKVIREMVTRAGVVPGDADLDFDDPAWASALQKLRPMREELMKTRYHIIEASTKAARINIKAQEAAIREQFSATFIMVMARVFDGLDLTPQQKRTAPLLVENALRLVERTD